MSSPKEIDLKCPVCEEVGKAFICVKCICSGDYTRSTMFCGHRCTADTAVAYDAKDATIVKWTMSDRENFSQLLEAEQTKINERFEELLAEYKKLEEIESYIAEYEFKISNIKNLIKLRKSEATLAEERSRSMVKNEERLRTRIESNTDSSKEIMIEKIDQCKSRVASSYAESSKIEAEIRKKNRENLLKLKEHIFPFERKYDKIDSCTTETLSNQNTQTGASVDSETDIIQTPPSGSWARQYPLQCTIVESWIPGDAGTFEYSEFVSLCKQREKLNQDFNLHLEDGYSTRDNPAFRISSALANITQLISVASSILDIRLPKKQKFFDWYPTYNSAGFEVFPSDNELFHKAAKLNANLSYLCLHQNVQTSLNPIMTGNNLCLIFDPDNSNLGRTGPISISQKLHHLIEETLLPDFNLFDAKDYEDFEFFDEELSDWENVSRSSVIDISHDNQTTITSESILTNLAETCYNAVTSFIRG